MSTASRRRPRRRGMTHATAAQQALWLGPCFLLIAGAVLWPLAETVRASFQAFSLTGRAKGWAGFANYTHLLSHPALGQVLLTTAVWVLAGVALTTLLALPLAQLCSKRFSGRGLLQLAIIVPWAASVAMTAIGFRWILNYYYGVLNPLLAALHLIDAPVDWLADPRTARWAMLAVVVFVSLPFTTFTLLSGLQSIPDDVLEAARVDGASPAQTYRHVTLPLLRGPLNVSIVLNALWIFNSFPIIFVLDKSNPGYAHDTTTTFMYKLAFLTDHDVGAAAAMAVVNVLIAAVATGLFVRQADLSR